MSKCRLEAFPIFKALRLEPRILQRIYDQISDVLIVFDTKNHCFILTL